MHRIDGPTASLTLPAPGAVVATPGFFTDGDPDALIPPTTMSFDWANSVQEEIAHVIEAAGLTLDKASNTQLLAALTTLFVPTAAPVFTHSGSTWRRVAADGFIECGGVLSLGTTNEQAFSFNFPTAFPNECLGISAMIISTSNVTGDTQIQEVSLTATTANLFIQSDTHPFSDASSFRYRAWGR